jgi:aldose 1-epimerase
MTASHALILEEGEASVELAPSAGGAVAGFTLAGVEVLRPTSANARAAGNVLDHAAYPLVPYSNRIANARFEVSGRTHQLESDPGVHPHSLHGVGWRRRWSVPTRSPTTATLTLEHHATGADARAWPFAFAARQEFVLEATNRSATLAMTLTLASRDTEPFPCGLGWHPFFPRTAATRLRFGARGRWESDASGLPTVRTIAEPGAFATGRELGGAALDHVFFGWSGRAELRQPDTGLRVVVTASERCRHLVVYAPRGEPFLAVEPVTHVTDAFNRAAAGEADTGIALLQPGAEISCSIAICATLAA